MLNRDATVTIAHIETENLSGRNHHGGHTDSRNRKPAVHKERDDKRREPW